KIGISFAKVAPFDKHLSIFRANIRPWRYVGQCADTRRTGYLLRRFTVNIAVANCHDSVQRRVIETDRAGCIGIGKQWRIERDQRRHKTILRIRTAGTLDKESFDKRLVIPPVDTYSSIDSLRCYFCRRNRPLAVAVEG